MLHNIGISGFTYIVYTVALSGTNHIDHILASIRFIIDDESHFALHCTMIINSYKQYHHVLRPTPTNTSYLYITYSITEKKLNVTPCLSAVETVLPPIPPFPEKNDQNQYFP